MRCASTVSIYRNEVVSSERVYSRMFQIDRSMNVVSRCQPGCCLPDAMRCCVRFRALLLFCLLAYHKISLASASRHAATQHNTTREREPAPRPAPDREQSTDLLQST